jgi:hypothetical protein
MIVRRVVAALAMSLLLLVGCSSHHHQSAGPQPLIGLFRLAPGAVDGDKITGTWFRMVQPGGTPEAGPYMPNGDSPAQGGTTTLISPGAAGGLRTGGYQSEPNPGFDHGDSLAASIMTPTKFFAVKFGVSTNPIDPQTQRAASTPSATADGDKLTADLSAWAASWNGQEFNQGAPKPPDKQAPQVAGQQQAQQVWDWVAQKWLKLPSSDQPQGPPATGTYDPATRHFTLQWTSLIVGGPFNGFTGVWHLEGVFEPDAGAPVSATSAATPTN